MMSATSINYTFCAVLTSGIIPWNAVPGKACGSTLADMCNTPEVKEAIISSTFFPILTAGFKHTYQSAKILTSFPKRNNEG